MPDGKLPFIRVDRALTVVALFAVMPLSVFAQNDLPAELRRCSLIDDGAARLDCYDALSGRESPAEGRSAGVQQETAETAAEPDQKIPDQEAIDVTIAGQALVGERLLDGQTTDKTTLDQERAEEELVDKEIADTQTLDDIASDTLPGGSRDDAEKLEIRATVSRCEKDFRKKYLFHFDNGQIWKQTSDKRLYFKECNFDVTITKDFFGYKMQQDGEKRRIRISRVK